MDNLDDLLIHYNFNYVNKLNKESIGSYLQEVLGSKHLEKT